MPKLLVDQDTFPSAISVPVDGDQRNGAAFEVPYQALANRTRNVRNELDGGIKRVREVADKAALLALAGVKTGDWAYVVGLGLYRFQTTADFANIAHSPSKIASPSQGGNWLSSTSSDIDSVLFANDGGFVAPGNLKIHVAQLSLAGPTYKTSAAVTHERVHFVDSDGDKTISVADGDVIFAYGSMFTDRDYTLADPSGTPQIRIVLPETSAHLTLKRASDGATIASMVHGGGAAPYFWSVLCQYGPTGWVRIG